MTMIHVDRLDTILDCFDTVAIANAYIELSARLEADAAMRERVENMAMLTAMADHLAHRVRDKRP